jgi:acyl-coenzyme A thioesterase PaaI-like protein
MAFADAVLGTAVNLAIDGAPSATMTLNTDFISTAKALERVEGEAEVTRRTRSVVFVQGRVYAGDKTLLTATGIWKVLGAK